MSKVTPIQWCDHTYSPWRGCRKVAPECANCYITTTAPLRTIGQKHGSQRVRAGEATLREPLRWNRAVKPHRLRCIGCRVYVDGKAEAGEECLICKQPLVLNRPRVFCLSLGDWLDDEVPSEWLADLLQMIKGTQNLDYLLLTKRPQNWRRRLKAVAAICGDRFNGPDPSSPASTWLAGDAPANVWIGVSAGADAAAALAIPAKIHFLSCEPMLGPLVDSRGGPREPLLARFDWIIFGGESGPKARPCNIEWIRAGVHFCQGAGIAAFVKQLGAIPLASANDIYPETKVKLGFGPMFCLDLRDKKGGDPAEWPEDLRVREFPGLSALRVPRPPEDGSVLWHDSAFV